MGIRMKSKRTGRKRRFARKVVFKHKLSAGMKNTNISAPLTVQHDVVNQYKGVVGKSRAKTKFEEKVRKAIYEDVPALHRKMYSTSITASTPGKNINGGGGGGSAGVQFTVITLNTWAGTAGGLSNDMRLLATDDQSMNPDTAVMGQFNGREFVVKSSCLDIDITNDPTIVTPLTAFVEVFEIETIRDCPYGNCQAPYNSGETAGTASVGNADIAWSPFDSITASRFFKIKRKRELYLKSGECTRLQLKWKGYKKVNTDDWNGANDCCAKKGFTKMFLIRSHSVPVYNSGTVDVDYGSVRLLFGIQKAYQYSPVGSNTALLTA